MRNVWTIARREFSRFFTSPIAYIVAVVILFTLGLILSLVVWGGVQSALNASFGGPAAAPTISPITGSFAFLFVLLIPALTMRLISEENRMGTMELLLTAPVRDWELIVGKWLGGLLFMLTIIGASLIYPLILNQLESPGIDQPQMVFSYLGIILVAAAFLALGVGISAIFTNQIAAFFATLGVFILLWWLIGFPANYTTGPAADFFNYLSMQTHFYNNSLNDGVLKTPDIVYFLSLIALGLFAGTSAVEARRWS